MLSEGAAVLDRVFNKILELTILGHLNSLCEAATEKALETALEFMTGLKMITGY